MAKQSQKKKIKPVKKSSKSRKYLTGRKWELVGYSWRQGIVSGKWDVMRVFGDGSTDPAEPRSYETEAEARKTAKQLARRNRVFAFSPEHRLAVFDTTKD